MRKLSIVLAVSFVLIVIGPTLFLSSNRTPAAAISGSFPSLPEARRQWDCSRCGGLPEYAFLAEDGSCWLVCHPCGQEWRFQRIKCAYCGNEEQDTLGYFFSDTNGGHFCRFYVCDKCHKYIKTLDARTKESMALTSLQKLVVGALEKEVQTLGYKRGW